MNRNFERSLSLVLKYEGGFSDNPADPGGATNKGITLATFRRYVKRNGRVEDLKRITDDQVATIYRKQYWDRINGDKLPSGIDFATFDFAVNSGPARAAKYLQTAVGAPVDGKIGPHTILACQNRPSAKVVHDLCANRLAFLKRLKTWSTFGRGWAARVASVEKNALDMMRQSDAAVRKPSPQPARPAPASRPVPRPSAPRPSGGKTAGIAGAIVVAAAALMTWRHEAITFFSHLFGG